MMIIQILEMTLPVAVMGVNYKSSYSVINTIEKLALIKNIILSEVKSIESVLPTVYAWEEYVYNDKESAYTATDRALRDTLESKQEVKSFMQFLRRLFIVSGKCIDDGEFHHKMIDMYHLEKYKEVNKDEM